MPKTINKMTRGIRREASAVSDEKVGFGPSTLARSADVLKPGGLHDSFAKSLLVFATAEP